MPLPGITINFQNGQLGQFLDLPDGVFGLLASATAVAATFALNTPYQVRGMADVAALGIIPNADNFWLYRTLEDFYSEAGDGTELWLMGFVNTTKPSDWFTVDGVTGKTPAEKLLDAANGKLTMLFTCFAPSVAYVSTIETGLDSDVWVALPKAQLLAENYTKNKYAPFTVLFEGWGYDGNKVTLKDLTTLNYNRCQIMIGSRLKRTGVPACKGASVGILAGRKARTQVHINPGMAVDGPTSNITAYIVDTPAEQYDITTVHEKGFVTFRTHTGKSGYFFTDDPMACSTTDDYHYGTHRRVIDKAYRLAYIALVDFILKDSNRMPNGSISPIDAKTIEAAVIASIFGQMTNNGELSVDASDPRDRGVICKVDLAHNITADSKLKIATLQVRSKVYNRFIDVPLGFVPVTTQ